MKILFYGDPHGLFDPLFAACERDRPDHVVLVGDLELEIPFLDQLAPVLQAGIPAWYIIGNHDTDTTHHHDLLVKNCPQANLGGRHIDLSDDGRKTSWPASGGVRLAGLGGVFKGKIWYPRQGDEKANWHSPEDYCARNVRWNDWLPLQHRDSIFPSYLDYLACAPCDILVTHEAPSTHDLGFPVIDRLAETMEARLIVHGHHHIDYDGVTTGGVRVRGLAARECWSIDTDDL